MSAFQKFRSGTITLNSTYWQAIDKVYTVAHAQIQTETVFSNDFDKPLSLDVNMLIYLSTDEKF